MKRQILRQLITGLCCVVSMSAIAETPPLLDFKIDNSPATLQRGAELVQEKCLLCHDMKYMKYRDLEGIGFSEEQLKMQRGDHETGDPVLSMMDAESRQGMLGMVPPDLTLMARARRGGERYIYSFLLGFYETPEGEASNRYFPGTKMPDPLGITYASEGSERDTIHQQVEDIVAFLSWAADPHASERHTLGYYVIAYLVLLTALLYVVKRRVWHRLDDRA